MSASGESKVLIIDDEADVCFLLGRILNKRNLNTDFVKSLAEAAVSIESNPPTVVFLDNSLPDGQGIEFIPQLKAACPEALVIMVTANDGLTDKKRAFQLGADDFLAKPLSREIIYSSLDKLGLRASLSETFPAL